MKYALLFIVALFLLNSCGKSGCTDSQALNYDATAKFNDESCDYFAEAFGGKYTAYDSILTNYGDTTLIFDGKIYFEIKRTDKNNVYLKDFIVQGINNWFILNTNHVSVIDSADYPEIWHQDFNFKNDTLFYKVEIFHHSELDERHWGFAIRE